MVFPVIKLGYLAFKQVSKPLANFMKARAKTSPFFRRYICAYPAQIYHRFETNIRMRLLGLRTDSVKPLNEEMAVELGAEMLGEVVIFSAAGLVLYLESARSSAKENAKDAAVDDSIERLESQVCDLALVVERQATELRELNRFVRSLDLGTSTKGRNKKPTKEEPCEILVSTSNNQTLTVVETGNDLTVHNVGTGLTREKYEIYGQAIMLVAACLLVYLKLLGCAILGVGVYTYAAPGQLQQAIGGLNLIVSYLLMGVGGFLFVVGFAGCAGAWWEKKWLLCIYVFLLIILSIVEVTVIGVTYYMKGQAMAVVIAQVSLLTRFKYGAADAVPLTQAVDLMQTYLGCCGFSTYTDWNETMYYTSSDYAAERAGTAVPVSCCKTQASGCNAGSAPGVPNNPDLIFPTGCVESVYNYILKFLNMVMIITIVLLVIQLMCNIFACCICYKM